MKKTLFSMLVMTAVLSAGAAVPAPSGGIVVDGKFDEASWASAPKYTNFTRSIQAGGSAAEAQTEFRLLADRDAVYIGVKCLEPAMNKVNKDPRNPLWATDGNTVDIFLAPSGDPEDYYLFEVSAGNNRNAMFYAEKGNIRPDIYLPEWQSAVFHGKDFWSAEVRIPLTAFYMTRNARWRGEWLVNVARYRSPTRALRELSSWSKLYFNNFHQSDSFNKIAGFPSRKASDDIYLREIEFSASVQDGTCYRGVLTVTAEAAPEAAGERTLTLTTPDGKKFTSNVRLQSGVNRFTVANVELSRPSPGKSDIWAELKAADGSAIKRAYPCLIEYAPVRLTLTTPGYRNNFYPGQKTDRIAGYVTVKAPGAEKVTFTLTGDHGKVKPLTIAITATKVPFEFTGVELPEGASAVVKAEVTGKSGKIAEAALTVKRPISPKDAKTIVWIENGRLIVNGKPTITRDIFAPYYMGSRKFRKRFDADDLGIEPFTIFGIQEWRFYKTSEATRDIKPSPEVFEEIRKRVLEAQKKNFHAYYISDEPECRNISPILLKHIYEFVKELDPFHPILISGREPQRYVDCADIITTHPYIGPQLMPDGSRGYYRPVNTVRNYVRKVDPDLNPNKVIGLTGSAFCANRRYGSYGYPTFPEYEAFSWSALANGAQMLYPYAYHDLGDQPRIYEAFRYMNTSVTALEPWLLSKVKPPVQSTFEASKSDAALFEHDGGLLLIVTNLVPEKISGAVRADALKKLPKLYEFRGEREFALKDGALSFELEPFGCAVLTGKKLDTKLPSRREVLAKVAKLEAAQYHRGNLLFEQGFKLTEFASSSQGSADRARLKLFDGALDMLAWQSKNYAKENWIEISFPNRSPKFGRLAVYGDGVENTTVKIWQCGEWQSPATSKVEKDTERAIFDFGAPLVTIKLRLDFGATKGQAVEVYEVELLK